MFCTFLTSSYAYVVVVSVMLLILTSMVDTNCQDLASRFYLTNPPANLRTENLADEKDTLVEEERHLLETTPKMNVASLIVVLVGVTSHRRNHPLIKCSLSLSH
jgi:hypothetical protein